MNKNGRLVEFVDEETGDIIVEWVENEDVVESESESTYAELWQKEKEIREKLAPIEDEIESLDWELRDVTCELNNAYLDQEEEVGALYAAGKHEESYALAQQFGEYFDRLQERQKELKKRIAELSVTVEMYYEEISNVWYDEER